MVGPPPVETAAVNSQNVFAAQEIEHHFFIVCDIELLDIYLGKCVKRALRLNARDAGDIRQH